MSKRLQVPVLAVALVLCLARAGWGQMNTAEIRGKITDPSGRVVAGATVMARQAATGRLINTVTNAAGQYLLAQLPVGAYRLSVRAPGFRQAVQPRLQVHAGDQIRQDIAMVLGSQRQVVVARQPSGVLQVESAAIQSTIRETQVMKLPLNSRQFVDLVGLTAGITHAPAGTRGGALQQTGPTWGILGQRGGHNLYLVDGTSVTDEYYNNLALSPSIDAIQEVRLDKTSYGAEFGGKSGGVINVITKSGSNRFHGSLFEYFRNSALDARNYFDSPSGPIPTYQQNQFGGTLGGPLRQGRAFFFVIYEGERVRQSQTKLFTVPTGAERLGNFQNTGITAINPATGAPFANDTIPVVDPVAAALMARFPQANLPGLVNNLRAVELSTSAVDNYDARLDDTFGSKDSASVRGSVYADNQFDPFGLGALNESLLPGFGYNLTTHTDNVAASWTHVFGPAWLNELRFGWMWVGGGQTSPNAGTDVAAQTGLQGVTANRLDMGYPQAAVAGFSTMGEPTQYVTRQDGDVELFDDAIWQHGAHTVKFGAYFFDLSLDPVDPATARGLFHFTGQYTGNGLGDFLLGAPALGSVGVGGRGALQGRTHWLQAYIQDGWQVNASLKLDVGLRVETNQNMTSADNTMAVVNLQKAGGEFVIANGANGRLAPQAAALLPMIPIPYVTARQAGWNRSLMTTRPVRLAPRIGLAWSWPGQNTVVRAGYGLYTNQAAYSVIQNAALNLPFFFAKTVSNAAGAVPAYNTESILAAPATGAVGANNVDHNFKIEYNDVWNLAIQRRLTQSTSLQAEYVGSYTIHADNVGLQNLYPGGLASSDPRHLRPIPQMSGFTSVVWNGWEKYNALSIGIERHSAHGLTLNANYTWSKALDDASNPGPNNAGTNLPQDPTNMAAEKGLSDFDHRHRLVASFLYDLLFFQNPHGWAMSKLAGWRVGGIWTLESGSPFTVNLPNDNANNGTPVASQRPDLVCDPNQGPKSTAEWFKTSCFVNPPALAYGTAGRDIVIGPGLDNFDATLQRGFGLGEGRELELRVDMFNALNHPNFNQPNRMFTATRSSFGAISSARDPRLTQFALRLSF